MAVLLQIKNAHKSYGDQVLLDGAEATITDDVKVGFVGRNGAGKSTLLRSPARRRRTRQRRSHPPSQAATRLSAAARSVPAGRNGARIPDARQRPARLEMRRSRRAVRAQGALPRRARSRKLSGGWQTASSWRRCCCTNRTCCCSTNRRTFSILRTQILLEHFLRDYQRSLPDRLARSGVPRRDLQPHARSVARQADDVSRQDRRLSRISSRNDASTTNGPTRPCWPSGSSSKSSSPRTKPAPAPPRGRSRRASSSNSWK